MAGSWSEKSRKLDACTMPIHREKKKEEERDYAMTDLRGAIGIGLGPEVMFNVDIPRSSASF